MKITFISPAPNLMGGQRVKATYADLLQARGHEVTVVAPRQPKPKLTQDIRSLLKGQRPRRFPKTTHYDHMTATLKLIEQGKRISAEDVPDADVVIASWWETAFITTHLPPEKGRKFYFVQGHEIHNPHTQHLSAGSYYLPLKKITIASWLKNLMAEKYGDHDVALVPNSVEQSLFYAPPRQKQKRPTIGLMYDVRPVKGLETACRVLEIVADQLPDLQVITFGTVPANTQFPMPPNTKFNRRPSRDKLRNIYASCDAFLFSSRHEGFGLPVLEAMACRTPVVGTRTGCAPDAITDGVSGYLTEIDDIETLAQRLIQVLTAQETDWQAMSEAAHHYVQNYSWDTATERFERVLMAE